MNEQQLNILKAAIETCMDISGNERVYSDITGESYSYRTVQKAFAQDIAGTRFNELLTERINSDDDTYRAQPICPRCLSNNIVSLSDVGWNSDENVWVVCNQDEHCAIRCYDCDNDMEDTLLTDHNLEEVRKEHLSELIFELIRSGGYKLSLSHQLGEEEIESRYVSREFNDKWMAKAPLQRLAVYTSRCDGSEKPVASIRVDWNESIYIFARSFVADTEHTQAIAEIIEDTFGPVRPEAL